MACVVSHKMNDKNKTIFYNKKTKKQIKQKGFLMKTKESLRKRQFTLIELLVVIAMIAITTNDCIIAK